MALDGLSRLRHVGGLVLGSVVVVVGAELLLLGDPTPLITRLDGQDRMELYKQVTTVSATLLGFLITAVAILVSLDRTREIVKDLRNGEAFPLLIINLLAAVVFLILLTAAGIVGAVFDDGDNGANRFELLYEVVLLVSLSELGFAGFFFGLVTYKVASND